MRWQDLGRSANIGSGGGGGAGGLIGGGGLASLAGGRGGVLPDGRSGTPSARAARSAA
jgi:hypothetical protein